MSCWISKLNNASVMRKLCARMCKRMRKMMFGFKNKPMHNGCISDVQENA